MVISQKLVHLTSTKCVTKLISNQTAGQGKRLMRLFFIAFFSLCILGCASQTSVYQGEHLVMPFIEEIKGWQLFQQEERGYRSNMWQKPGKRWVDTYAVSIYYGQSPDLNVKRAEMDAPGQRHCQKFESITLEHPKAIADEVLYWQTQCIQDDKVTAKVLHLMISGKESYYQIQKVWKMDVETEKFDTWRERFEQTFVCDMKDTSNPCPYNLN